MKTYTGKIISNKMNNTVVVEREITYRHPLFKKIIRKTRRIKVHSTTKIQLGTRVKIKEVRPISKDKHFEILEVFKEDEI